MLPYEFTSDPLQITYALVGASFLLAAIAIAIDAWLS